MNPTHINKTLTAIVSGDRQVNTVKVPNNPKLIDTSQPVTPKEVINSPHFRLQQLLTNLPALQRFVALLTSLSGTPAPSHSPVQQWLPQLLLPNNQAAVVQFLKQGAGATVLKQLIQQLATPNSTISQWLSDLSSSQQSEFKALLRLAAEQRVLPHSQADSNDPVFLQLHLAQAAQREIKCKVSRYPAQRQKKGKATQHQWRVEIELPIGDEDTLTAKAQIEDHSLALTFTSDSAKVLTTSQQLAPLLVARLATFGFETEPPNFHRVEKPRPASFTTQQSGLIAKV